MPKLNERMPLNITLLLVMFTLCLSMEAVSQDNNHAISPGNTEQNTLTEHSGVVGGLGGTGNTIEDESSNTRGLSDLKEKDIRIERDEKNPSKKMQKKNDLKPERCHQ